MVERFCDKLTLSITGKALYDKEGKIQKNDYAYKGSSSSQLYLEKDPTLWLSLAFGISSIVVYAVGEKKYHNYMNSYDVRADQYMVYSWSTASVPSPNYVLLWSNEYNSEAKYATNKRNEMRIISGSLGGASIALMLTFIGRSIYYGVNKDKIMGFNNPDNNISLFVPPQYINPVDWVYGKPGFGLGMSMRF
jgi:hypothetical protein